MPVPSDPLNANDAAREAIESDNARDRIAQTIQSNLPPEAQPAEELARSLAAILELEVRRTVEEYYSGPLPHPELLAKFEEVKPGITTWMLKRAAKEQAFRHRTQREALAIQREDRARGHDAIRLGQTFAFVIAMTAIAGGIYLTAIGKTGYGIAAIVTPLAALVLAFVAKTIASAGSHRRKRRQSDPDSTRQNPSDRQPSADETDASARNPR